MLNLSPQLSVLEPAISLPVHPTQQPPGCPRPSNRLSSRRSLGLRLHTEHTYIHKAAAVPEPLQQQSAVRAAATNLHHILPSVSSDRSIHLPKPAPTSGSVGQTSVTQTSMFQQPGSLEQMQSSLRQEAPMHTDVFCQDNGVQPDSSESNRPAELCVATQQ